MENESPTTLRLQGEEADTQKEPVPMPHPIHMPNGGQIYFKGAPLTEGPLPAVIYFALSGEATLNQDPFNQPVVALIRKGIRVFSWDLPFHYPGKDPHEAMQRWYSEFQTGSSFFLDFIVLCQENLEYLMEENLIVPQALAIAGLSRGGYAAVQFAASEKRIKTIVGFAPLTRPLQSDNNFHPDQFKNSADLSEIAEQLISKRIRFYIGNRDIRVGTEFCFSFIRHTTDIAFCKGVRSPLIELHIYPSIGFKGHGTPPEIFQDGADWMANQLHRNVS